MSKVSSFFEVIEQIVNRVGSTGIKDNIGDSINNNRTVTVNQLVRFLTTRTNKFERNLGYALRSIYNSARAAGVIERSSGRTDAVDIYELSKSVSNSPANLKRTLSGLVNDI